MFPKYHSFLGSLGLLLTQKESDLEQEDSSDSLSDAASDLSDVDEQEEKDLSLNDRGSDNPEALFMSALKAHSVQPSCVHLNLPPM